MGKQSMAHKGPRMTAWASPRLLLLGTTALLPLGLPAPAQAQAPTAVPTGGRVTAGQAQIQQQGTRTQITQGSDRAVIDWQRFDVGRDATVNFTQPSQNAWTLNRVNTPDPSMIAGRITANGGVAIVNPSGVVFAEGAQVNVGSLVASAAGITNQNFMAGRMVFDGTPNPGARVENRGQITVAERGLAALVAPGAANQGAIRARLGTAIVAGAETYRLDLAGDGLLSIEVTQAVRQAPGGGTALVTNSGVIAAEGGQVILTAQAASGLVEQVVRNTGQVTGARVAIEGRGGEVAIAAGAVTAPGGRVDITAPGAGVTVAAGARVSASGATGGGQVRVGGNGTARTRVEGRVAARGTGPNARGGRVAVQATERVTVAAGATVDASGAAGGGEALVGTTGLGRAQTMARETLLEAGATVRADATEAGPGGVIVVNSAERTAMAAQLSARGGPQGGDGGFVEVSGMQGLTLNFARVDVGAGPGGAAGTLLIDPRNIIVRDTPAADATEQDGALAGGGFTTDGAGGDPTTIIITPADIAGFAGNVTLEAQDSLVVASAITMPANSLTLRTTNFGGTGIEVSAPISVLTGSLTLTSNSDIVVNANLSASGGVNLNATFGITGTGGVTTPGTLRVRGFDGTDASAAQGLNLTGTHDVGALDVRGLDAFVSFAQVAPLVVTRMEVGAGGVAELGSDGLISGGNVTAGDLVIRGAALGTSRAGGLALTGTNAVARLDARTADAALTFAQAGGFAVVQADAGEGDVTLGSGGIISGGGVVAGTLTVRDAALDLTDGRAGGLDISGTNVIARLDARTDNAALAFVQTKGFDVLQANARTGAGLGAGDAGGAVELVATNADSVVLVRADGHVQGGSIRLQAGAELSLLGPVLSVAPPLDFAQGHITLATTAADGRIVQGAGGTVTAADARSIVMTADVLTLAANMSAGASGLVEFNRLSPGRITIGLGGPGATAFNPAELATFLGTGHLRLVASQAVQVLADLTRTTGELTLRATSATGTTIAVDAAVNAGANPVNLETPGGILGIGVITTSNLVARGDGDILSRAGSVNLSGDNQAVRLNARTDGGDIAFRNAANLRVTRIDALGGTGGGAVGITLAGAGLLLEVANDISAGQLTMLADNMAIATGAPALIVPGGSVRLLPFTAGRAITLGGEVAGTLSLSTAELAAIGGAGVDGTTNPATVLRIGAGPSGDIRAGDVTVAGDVDLGGRVLALEIFAGGDLTGAGAITVGDFGAVAGGNLVLDGANAVARLAGITDTTLVNGQALGAVSLWGGTRNSDPLGLAPARETDRVEFRNTAPALTVAGSVLASGSGGLVLTQTGDLTVNANRWIAAEAGTLQVNVTGSLTNNGTLVAAPIALNAGGPDSYVLAGGGTNNGTIALGLDATPAPDGTRISGIATNNGLMVARTIAGITDNAGALITGTGIAGQFGTVFVGDRTVAGALVNTGTIIGDVTADSIENQAGGRILGGTIRATAGDIANAGVMLGTAIEAQGSVLQNGGSMGAGGGTATAEFSLTSAQARTGALTGAAAPATPPATVTETLGATATIRAETGDITQAGGAWVAAPDSLSLPGGGTLHFIAAAGDITQTGGTITAPGLTARAEGLIRLDQAGNSFARIGVSPGSLPAFPDAPAMGAFGIGTATGEVRLTTQATTLTVEAGGGIRAGTDALLRVEGGGLVVDAPIRVGATRSLTLLADDMALNAVAGGMTLVAPGGTVRLQALTTGRAITLGTEVAGTLSLTSAELARIGGTGANGATDAAQRLRIGGDAAGAITITGDVLLRQDVGPSDAASLTAAIGGARVAALELVSGGGITQDAGTRVNVAGLAARGLGGDVLLHDGAAPGAASGNAIDRIIAGTEAGTLLTPGAERTQDGLRASGNLTLSTWRSLAVEAPVSAGGDAVLRVAPGAGPGPAGVLTVDNSITVGGGRSLTLIADDMALGAVAGGMTLVAPAGAVRLMPFTTGRGVTLGDDGAGTLSLTWAELWGIGGSGADGRTDPASVLRIGALDGNTVGDIAVPGAVDLSHRLGALELYADGSITGSGGIRVRDLGAVAGRDLVLDGDNSVERLAPLTDVGTVNGVAPSLISLWGGTRNSDPLARQPDRLEFRSLGGGGTFDVEGSVLASGSGGLRLFVAYNTIRIPQNRWVTAEAGTVSVVGVGVINEGGIYAQDLSGGTVQSGLMGSFENTGTIILGCGCNPADTSTIQAQHGVRNSGLIVAGSIFAGRGYLNNAVGGELRAHHIHASDGLVNTGLLAADEIVSGLFNAGTLVAGTIRGGFSNYSLLAATEIQGGGILNQGLLVTEGATVPSLVNQAGARIENGTGQIALNLAMPDARAAALAGTPAPSGGALVLGTTRGGDLALQTTQGGLSNAGAIEADGAARLHAAGDLALTAGSVQAGGGLELSAGQDVLQSGGSLLAGGALRLMAGRDALQTGGTAQAASLGDAGAALTIGRDLDWRVTTPELFAITAGRRVDLHVAGGPVALRGNLQATGGDMALVVPDGTLSLDPGVSVVAGAALTLETGGALVAPQASLTAGGDMVLTAPGTLELGDVTAQAGGALTALAGGAFELRGGGLFAGGGLLARSGAGMVMRGGASAGGDVRLDAGTTLLLDAPLSAGADLLLVAGDAMALGGTTLGSAGALEARAGSAMTLGAGFSAASGGALTLEAGGALEAPLATLSAGGAMTLTAGTGLALGGGSLTAGQSLGLTAGAAGVSLQDVVARAEAGGITLASSGGVSLRNTSLTAGQGVDLQAAGDVVMNPSTLAAGGAIHLDAGGTLGVTGGAMQAGLGLLLRSGGGMRLSGVALGASTAPAATPAEFQPLRLESGADMSVTDGTLRAERAELISGGSLTTAGSAFAIGTGLLLTAPGGIGQAGEAPTQVGALDPSRAPLVILDTRRGVAVVRLPDALTPATADQPGVAPTSQRWQVAGTLNQPGQLLFGADDGSPATPSSAPAGNIAFNMNAGQLPVFVLLDGGTATGRLQAGRLGVFGRPGTPLATGRAFELLGELGGIGGVGVARLGQLAGAGRGLGPDALGLSQYRFNDCVISTVNCVAPVSFTLPPVPQANTLVLMNPLPRLDESDVLLPNVADEDY